MRTHKLATDIEKRIDSAVAELTELLRQNGHKIDDSDDYALMMNVLAGHFLTPSKGVAKTSTRREAPLVAVEWGAPDETVWTVTLKHGEKLAGRNLVAVIGGHLHRDCVWCDALRSRCKSRRGC